MKQELLDLIEQSEKIKLNFSTAGNACSFNTIQDKPQFICWLKELRFELQDVYDRTDEKIVSETLEITDSFDGWTDVMKFSELFANLSVIKKNIDRFYPNEKEAVNMSQKSPKIFISHSTNDKEAAEALVDLLEDIGLNNQHIFCSSVSGYNIPLGKDIFTYLRDQFKLYDLHVIFILSNNYYKSPDRKSVV